MASGVAWREVYDDPTSDVFIDSWESISLQRYLSLKPRVAPPGQEFNYNTAETNLVGTLLRAATGNNLATYLSEKIWRPFGMEATAKWMLTEPGGGEFGGCCLSATLRDYARLGLFALAGGVLPDGTRVLPEGWMDASVAPSAANPGYGYMWWPQKHGGYAASGIFGQRIYINPEKRLVIAQHAARQAAASPDDLRTQATMEVAVAGVLAGR
jgi:CubicO group peptidase (beta-lactamase class C family)